MARNRRIVVRGKQQSEIDPVLLMQILLAISHQAETAERPESVDVGQAAIEVTEGAR